MRSGDIDNQRLQCAGVGGGGEPPAYRDERKELPRGSQERRADHFAAWPGRTPQS